MLAIAENGGQIPPMKVTSPTVYISNLATKKSSLSHSLHNICYKKKQSMPHRVVKTFSFSKNSSRNHLAFGSCMKYRPTILAVLAGEICGNMTWPFSQSLSQVVALASYGILSQIPPYFGKQTDNYLID